jgi:hypothetical protein
MRIKIILAAPTLLYSPIYLAKELTLSKEFAHTDLIYPDNINIYFDSNQDYISKKDSINISITDPIRFFLFSPLNPINDDKPLIIGSLINKMCYWMGNYFDSLNPMMFRNHFKLFTHPIGMTGFAVAYHLLKNHFKVEEETILDHLKSTDFPGDEIIWHKYLNYSPFLRNKYHLSYLTIDPFFFKNAKAIYHLDDMVEYKKCMMTAIITTQENFKKYEGIIQDITEGINAGIDFIYKDPTLAAEIIFNYGKLVEDSEMIRIKQDWKPEDLTTFFRLLSIDEIYGKANGRGNTPVNKEKPPDYLQPDMGAWLSIKKVWNQLPVNLFESNRNLHPFLKRFEFLKDERTNPDPDLTTFVSNLTEIFKK